MALPLLNVGLWIQGERDLSVCVRRESVNGWPTDSPTKGGFSTFLLHCKLSVKWQRFAVREQGLKSLEKSVCEAEMKCA